jgi:tripartite-type tricarboxylate transporter receptor subunit TctC
MRRRDVRAACDLSQELTMGNTTGLGRRTFLATGLMAAAGASGALAQETFPSRPVKVVVGFPPGGGTDLLARVLAQRLGEDLGQPIVIENRPGASGTIAASSVAHAQPDGYSVFFATSGHAGNAALYPNLGYDTVKDFEAVGLAGRSSVLVMVSAQSRYRSLKDLVKAARDNPGKLNYGAGGGGATLTNLAYEEMKHRLGIDVATVPYKGSSPAQLAVMSGEVDFTFDTVSGGSALVRSGKVRGIAVTSAERTPILPDVPTIAEELLPGFDVVGWYGLLATGRTPAPVVARLNAALNRVLAQPETRKRMTELGVDPASSTPAEFAVLLAREATRWEATIRRLGIKV